MYYIQHTASNRTSAALRLFERHGPNFTLRKILGALSSSSARKTHHAPNWSSAFPGFPSVFLEILRITIFADGAAVFGVVEVGAAGCKELVEAGDYFRVFFGDVLFFADVGLQIIELAVAVEFPVAGTNGFEVVVVVVEKGVVL